MNEKSEPFKIDELVEGKSLYRCVTGEEWFVDSIRQYGSDSEKYTTLRKRNYPKWGTYNIGKESVKEFSLVRLTEKELKTNQQEYSLKQKRSPGDPNYFACTCSPEKKDECLALLKEVKELLKTDDDGLLSSIINSLSWDYEAEITSIGCEQWFGIWSKTNDYDNVLKKDVDPPIFSKKYNATTWNTEWWRHGMHIIKSLEKNVNDTIKKIL